MNSDFGNDSGALPLEDGPAENRLKRCRINMGKAFRLVNCLTIAGGIGLLILSLWPGFLIGCWLILAYPLILGLAGAWFGTLISILRKNDAGEHRISTRQILLAPMIVLVTYASLRLYVPRRVAFLFCKGQFENCISAAPIQSFSVPLNRWLGIYRVDEFAADPRGGVFFRTGTAQDGIGPNQISYGFVYRPNPNGSPFGTASYRTRRLFGDWYWFQVTDDW